MPFLNQMPFLKTCFMLLASLWPVPAHLKPQRASRSAAAHRPLPPDILERIKWCESRFRYDAVNRSSGAGGAYQVLRTTWDGYAGYAQAQDAPPEVQDRWAREALAKAGTRPWAASASCWRR